MLCLCSYAVQGTDVQTNQTRLELMRSGGATNRQSKMYMSPKNTRSQVNNKVIDDIRKW